MPETCIQHKSMIILDSLGSLSSLLDAWGIAICAAVKQAIRRHYSKAYYPTPHLLGKYHQSRKISDTVCLQMDISTSATPH